jgi:hypothetical protein
METMIREAFIFTDCAIRLEQSYEREVQLRWED